VSICIHCGQDHDASLRICPKSGKALGAAAPSLRAAAPSLRAAAPSLRAAAPSVDKTLFGLPAAFVPPPRTSLQLPPPGLPPIRLPTESEARENPDLVIRLDLTPPPASPSAAQASAANATPNTGGARTPDAEMPMDLPDVAFSGKAGVSEVATPVEETPTDLPPPGQGKPFVLPQPKQRAAPREARQVRNASFAERLTSDARSVIDLFQWAWTAYLRKPGPFFVLVAMLVLPASVLQSCLLAGVARGPEPSALAPGVATVDFSARKAALAARIQASQARGEMDKQAAAELAALTTVETAQVPLVEERASERGGFVREKLALLIQGLLLFGLAFPMACGALAIAAADRLCGAALPGLGDIWPDIWPILLARSELFLISLVPAALLVAAGQMLFVLPGLILSVLFVFVPHAVLFEKRGGRPALARSIELVRSDIVRVVLAFVSFALLGFVATTLTELLLPTSGSRAVVFLHFIISDLLSVAILPVPGLVLARIYLDLRARAGANPERLARAART